MNDKYKMHSTQIIGMPEREQSNQKRRNYLQKIIQGSCLELKNIGFQMERSHYIRALHTTYT